MLSNSERTSKWCSSEEENNPTNFNLPSNGGNRYSDLESSGVFIAGYTGPIHRWEHPGYQFLTESAQGRNFKLFFHITPVSTNSLSFKFKNW